VLPRLSGLEENCQNSIKMCRIVPTLFKKRIINLNISNISIIIFLLKKGLWQKIARLLRRRIHLAPTGVPPEIEQVPRQNAPRPDCITYRLNHDFWDERIIRISLILSIL
jgi:hypothetical protein